MTSKVNGENVLMSMEVVLLSAFCSALAIVLETCIYRGKKENVCESLVTLPFPNLLL